MVVIRTVDGCEMGEGDVAFNHYDMQPGRIGRVDSRPQPDPLLGQDMSTPMSEWSNYWFDFEQEDGRVCSLDGSRICSIEFAQRKGWC